MKKIIAIVALMMISLISISSVASAEPKAENRTVAEFLNEKHDEEETNTVEGEPIISEEPLSIEQNPFILFMQLFGALLLVIVLIYLLLRFINKRTRSYRSTQALQNLGGVALGSNRSVQLVKVGERLLVVGVGETIQLLKEIDDEKEIEELLNLQEQQFETFEQPLVTYVKRMFTNRKEEKQADESFQEIFKTRLNEVKDSQQKLREVIRERDK